LNGLLFAQFILTYITKEKNGHDNRSKHGDNKLDLNLLTLL